MVFFAIMHGLKVSGRELSRWSRTSIAREIRPILKQMGRRAPSARTVGRWLKAERLRPWRYHSWQHLHDLESFLVRARPVLEAYPQAKALLTQGIKSALEIGRAHV